MNKIIFLLIFFIGGCSQRVLDNPLGIDVLPALNNTTFTFDPSFTEHQKDVMRDGFAIWNQDTDGQVVYTEVANGQVRITNMSEQQAEEIDKLGGSEGQATYIYGATFRDDYRIAVLTWRIPNDTILKETAAHELGHMIGMLHIPETEPALMNPFVVGDTAHTTLYDDLHLTQFDINQYCDHWGCKN